MVVGKRDTSIKGIEDNENYKKTDNSFCLLEWLRLLLNLTVINPQHHSYK